MAWLSRNQIFCSATIRSVPADGEASEYSECASAPSVLLTSGAPKLTSPPIPRAAPTNPASQALVLFIGTVRGPAATVEVSLPETTVAAVTRSLTMPDAHNALAYAVWLPTRGRALGGLPWGGITSVVAYDQAGAVVERIDVA
jgi:hypothetical protein